MHSIFILLGLIFICVTEFLDVAWMKGSSSQIKIALTFTGKYCMSNLEQEVCQSLEECNTYLCVYEKYLPLMSGLIIGFALTSILLNLIIYKIIKKIQKQTLQIINVIDIIQNLIPSFVTLFVFVNILILDCTYREWDFQVATIILLVLSCSCFITSFYFLLKNTIKKRNLKQGFEQPLLNQNQ